MVYILMNQQTSKFFNAGEQLPNEAGCLWSIVNGVVKSYTFDSKGRSLILGFWGQEEVVGYSLSSVEPYYLQCLTDVEVVAIHTSQLHHISDKLLSRVKQIQRLTSIIQHSDPKNRLWLLLKWLESKFGTKCSTGQLIDLPLTEQELADTLGISGSVTSRILNQLQKENLILYSEINYIIFLTPTEQLIMGDM